jgi:hypothetical protein
MKHSFFFTLGIIILSMVSVTTSPAQLQQAQPQSMQAAPPAIRPVPPAPGPYYATPSWSQKLPASVRFIVLSDWDNAAVLDKETGLVWERTPVPDKKKYDVLFVQCLESKVGNRSGWRLPKAHELASLIDPSATSYPTLPLGHPFSMPRKDYTDQWRYWTSDVFPFATQYYITISLDNVNQRYRGYTLKENASSWCVRGPGELY